jgi:hypothetical protein
MTDSNDIERIEDPTVDAISDDLLPGDDEEFAAPPPPVIETPVEP